MFIKAYLVVFAAALLGSACSEPVPEYNNLLSERPSFEAADVSLVRSSMNDTLVRAAGSIKYLDLANTKQVYDSVEVQAVALDKKGEKSRLTLSIPSGAIDFDITEDAQKTEVEKMTLRVMEGIKVGLKCEIEMPGVESSAQKHYASMHAHSYKCKQSGRTVAEVTFDVLEFEINGNPELTKELQFTTEAEEHEH